MKTLTTQLHDKCLHVAEELPESQHEAREAIYALSDEVERLKAVILNAHTLMQCALEGQVDDSGADAEEEE